jgi:hypothetical protein
MGVEMTSGFDSQIINAVQLVDPWQECLYTRFFICDDLSNPLSNFAKFSRTLKARCRA